MATTSELTDRELDALLAERLFGWTSIGYGTDSYTGAREILLGSPFGDFRDRVPDYSITGDGMLQVVDKMRERGYGFGLQRLNSEGFAHPWEAEFYRSAYREFPAAADTAPRAVAEAAKAAIEAEG